MAVATAVTTAVETAITTAVETAVATAVETAALIVLSSNKATNADLIVIGYHEILIKLPGEPM